MKILNTDSHRSTLPSRFPVSSPVELGWRGDDPTKVSSFPGSTGAQGSFGDISVASSLINMQIQ